jgi:hypothetical protein
MTLEARQAATVVDLRVRGAGSHRVGARGPEGLEAVSNPLLVGPDLPRLLWGDLHGHSQLSDGTGDPENYFAYARDVSALDVAALTDHDHWGRHPRLDASPAIWGQIRQVVQRFHEPGRFVTVLGYEWTNWIHGHRHVLFAGDDGPVLSAIDPAWETPPQLWAGLRGHDALTFAHHPAGGPIATNWAFPPDPELEPLVEIASIAGSSEAPDAGKLVEPVVAKHFVRDALDLGYRLGFVGSGDSHDGHPGCPRGASRRCGLAGILAEQATREAVIAALRARRVYATSGDRIWLDVHLDGASMGARVPPSGRARLAVRALAPAPLGRIDLVRSGRVVESIPAGGREDVELERVVEALRPGEYVYVRVVQREGGMAWSSPFFVE